MQGLATALGRRGHRVTIVTTTPDAAHAQGSRIPSLPPGPGGAPERPPPGGSPVRPAGGHSPGGAEGDAVPVVRVPSWLIPGVGIPLSPFLPARLRGTLAGEPTDVVHVHASIFSAGALAGGWAAHSLGLPTVATVHSVLGQYAWVHRLAHGLTGWGAWPQVVAGVSPQVAAELSRVLERPAEVLDNAVDVAWWREGPPPARRSGGEGLRLITVQRLKERKRGDALLDTLAGVRQRLPAGSEVELVFVGDGPRRGALERKAARLGLSVRFLGALSREEVRRALSSAHVFVMASEEESFGLAAVEARAVGLPVVAFRRGRLQEIAPDGAAGILVDNDHQMVAALARLATDETLLARLSEHSRNNPPGFDWETVAAQHEEAYRRAMLAAGRSP